MVFGKPEERASALYRRRTTVGEIVHDAGEERVVIKNGCNVRIG